MGYKRLEQISLYDGSYKKSSYIELITMYNTAVERTWKLEKMAVYWSEKVKILEGNLSALKETRDAERKNLMNKYTELNNMYRELQYRYDDVVNRYRTFLPTK